MQITQLNELIYIYQEMITQLNELIYIYQEIYHDKKINQSG